MIGKAPAWATQWPGRYERELKELADDGIEFSVNETAADDGRLAIDFSYDIGSETRRFRAIFPDHYPRWRPQILLVGPAEQRPARHCSPLDGNMCVLGRDSRQWPQDWTLARLIKEQLECAMIGGGDEDPQGEPAEFWWNTLARLESFVLVSSDLDLGGQTEGTLTLRFDARSEKEGLILRAAVEKVYDSGGVALDDAVVTFPDDLRQIARIKWRYSDQTLMPVVDQDNPTAFTQWLKSLCGGDQLSYASTIKLSLTKEAKLAAIAYPMEAGPGTVTTGWLFLLVVSGNGGRLKPGAVVNFTPIRVMRAGASDLSSRSPQVQSFREKCIAIYGGGAIGSFLAIEAARNGCRGLRLIDSDAVEPGNSVRWPMGVPAWGTAKVAALAAFINSNYPNTGVTISRRVVGNSMETEVGAAEKELDGADLAVDASASYSLATWLSDECRARAIPMISVYGSADMASGVVGAFFAATGCPRCLERMWAAGDIEEPAGFSAEEHLIQPVGCSERTFQGSSTDTQELALQAVRIAAAILSGRTQRSLVATVDFRSTNDGFMLPAWRNDSVRRFAECECARDE